MLLYIFCSSFPRILSIYFTQLSDLRMLHFYYSVVYFIGQVELKKNNNTILKIENSGGERDGDEIYDLQY